MIVNNRFYLCEVFRTVADGKENNMNTLQVERLVDNVGADGLLAHESSMAALVEYAHEMGVSPVLVNVLADHREPEVARIRALARISDELGTHRAPVPATTATTRPTTSSTRSSLVCATA